MANACIDFKNAYPYRAPIFYLTKPPTKPLTEIGVEQFLEGFPALRLMHWPLASHSDIYATMAHFPYYSPYQVVHEPDGGSHHAYINREATTLLNAIALARMYIWGLLIDKFHLTIEQAMHVCIQVEESHLDWPRLGMNLRAADGVVFRIGVLLDSGGQYLLNLCEGQTRFDIDAMDCPQQISELGGTSVCREPSSRESADNIGS